MTENVAKQKYERSALVLYGSETGNSQDAAEDLGRITEKLHFTTRVSEMDLIGINVLLNYTIVVFVISTTGQGDFPKNSRKFWKSLLRKRLPPGCLSHVSYTTFGLGDSSYPKFNWAARKLHKRLGQLGAQEIYPRGEGDEQHEEGIDGTFLSWSVDFRKHILASFPLPEGLAEIPNDVLLPPKYTLEIVQDVDLSEVDLKSTETPFPEKDLTNKPPVSSQKSLSTISISASVSSEDSSHRGETLVEKHELPLNITLLQTDSPEQLDIHTGSTMEYTPPAEPGPPVDCEQLKENYPDATDPVDTNLPPAAILPIGEQHRVKLIGNKRLTPLDHWQDVRELTFIASDEAAYEPGDTVTIYPKNFPEDVQTLIDLMGWNDVADKIVKFETQYPHTDYDSQQLLPNVQYLNHLNPTTFRQLLIHNLDITAIPKRFFFHAIANQTNDMMHKERLLEFTNPAYSDEFYDYTARPRRSILEVLRDFPSVKIPWQWVTLFFPLIRGRKYSISSGGIQKDYRQEKGLIKFQILVAIVKYRTVLRKIRQGLCSRYLASLPEGTKLGVQIEEGNNFYNRAKYHPKYPLLLIAPGTGVAPCRSLIWERNQLSSRVQANGRVYLFYGGRNAAADFFYKEEWKNLSLQTTAITAFSRDQKEKIYVQDAIRNSGKLVAELIAKEHATIYVCGSSGNMPKAVRQALKDVCVEFCGQGPFSSEEIDATFNQFEREGLYVQETWG